MPFESQIVSMQEIYAARKRLEGIVQKTPLIPLHVQLEDTKIYLKLENLQAIGSFKLRGACNAISMLSDEELSRGVYTASMGNFAQGLAWSATRRNVPCHVFMPDYAPKVKQEAVKSLGGQIELVPFDTWWKIITDQCYEGRTDRFIHPVCDQTVIAGNGPIGLEILEDLPDVDTVIIPYGGGGLSCGIASVFKELKPDVKIYACEVETAAPLAAAFAAGKPVECQKTESFVDGIGGKSVLPEMWDLVKTLINESLVASVEQVAHAIKLLVEKNHVVAEGAGACSVAVALSGKAGAGNIVCVISGGNINTDKLVSILQGQVPL